MYKSCEGVLVETQDNILVIKFNNIKKKNCINGEGYQTIRNAMRQVAKDEKIQIVVLIGEGDYFTAGNDLSAGGGTDPRVENLEYYTKVTFKDFVASFIDCPKIVISIVNGPCIGIGATLVALSDVGWCSENAYFLTPFTKLGIVPEACSTYLFPLILGRSKASEMLLLSQPLTAAEALRHNLVSRVFKLSELDTVIWPTIREFAKLPSQSLEISKNLIRKLDIDIMHKALQNECDALYERFHSEEFLNAVIAFSKRKIKSKL